MVDQRKMLQFEELYYRKILSEEGFENLTTDTIGKNEKIEFIHSHAVNGEYEATTKIIVLEDANHFYDNHERDLLSKFTKLHKELEKFEELKREYKRYIKV